MEFNRDTFQHGGTLSSQFSEEMYFEKITANNREIIYKNIKYDYELEISNTKANFDDSMRYFGASRLTESIIGRY